MLKMEWKTVHGTQTERPSILDLESSPTTVYLRKNIERVKVSDEFDTHYEWWYEECEIPIEYYNAEPMAINEMAGLIEYQIGNDEVMADMLLGQVEQSEQLEAQDEALAEILLNVIGA